MRVTVQTKSIIDHMWTNELHMILDSGIVLSNLSENFPIFAYIKRSLIEFCNERFVSFKKRLKNEHCDNHIREVIKNVDWYIDEYFLQQMNYTIVSLIKFSLHMNVPTLWLRFVAGK